MSGPEALLHNMTPLKVDMPHSYGSVVGPPGGVLGRLGGAYGSAPIGPFKRPLVVVLKGLPTEQSILEPHPPHDSMWAAFTRLS